MFSWYPVMDLARAPRRAARKKGSGYENTFHSKYRIFESLLFEGYSCKRLQTLYTY
jgi:hypothetical protein